MDAQEEKKTEIQGSWTPDTPYRPIPPVARSTYPQMPHEIQTEEATHSASERGFSVQNISGLDHLPFGALLALANKASIAASRAHHSSFSSSSLSSSCHPSNCRESQDNGNGTIEKSQCKSLTSSQHHYHPSYFHTQTENGAAAFGADADFAPITPEKPMRRNGKLYLEKQNSSTDEKKDKEQDQQNNEFVITINSSGEVQCCKEPQGLFGASSVPGIEEIKTPQKPRRKKHRPKVVREARAKSKTKPTAPKPPGCKETPTGKRKYVRKKDVSKGVIPAVESLGKDTYKPAKKSCRRALNFENELSPEGTSGSKSLPGLDSESHSDIHCEKGSQSGWTTKHSDGTIVKEYKVQADMPCNVSGQVLEESMSMAERQMPSITLTSEHKTSRTRRQNAHSMMIGNEKVGDRLAVPNDQESNAQLILQIVCDSNAMTERRQESKPSNEDLKSKDSNTSLSDLRCHSLQEYRRMSWLCFPSSPMEIRSNKDQHSGKSCTLSPDVATKRVAGGKPQSQARQEDPSASKDSFCMNTHFNSSQVSVTLGGLGKSFSSKLHSFEGVASISKTEYPRKKRSKTTSRARNITSLNRIIDCNAQPNSSFGQQPACCNRQEGDSSHLSVEDAISEIQVKVITKNQKTKRKTPASLGTKKAQMNQKIVVFQHHQFSTSLTGTPPDELWKQLFSVDAISEQLRRLDLNRESFYVDPEGNAIVPFSIKHQEQHALVPFQGDGAVVPYHPVKKQRPRPRVDLDDETNRVWRLLVQNINSEGIDGTDEEKSKWWENERRVFQGRADSFIARMRLVQGDRRFTPWKGSVVDSVVGVFLTQNVSDHLSSSAFMALAAQFPFKASCKNSPCCEDGGSSVTLEPRVYTVESQESLCASSAHRQDLHEADHKEGKEAVDSTKNLKSSGHIVSSTESLRIPMNSVGIVSETCHNLSVKGSNTEGIETETFMGVSGPKDDGLLPHDSMHSSQNSMTFSAPPNTETTGPSSEGKNVKNGPTFMELLRMAGSTMLQGHSSSNISSDDTSTDEHTHITALEYDTQQHMDPLSSQGGSKRELLISSGSFSWPSTTTQGVLGLETCRLQGVKRGSFFKNHDRNISYQGNIDANAPTEIQLLDDRRTTVQPDSQVEDVQTEQNQLGGASSTFQSFTESTTSLAKQVNTQPTTPESKKQGHSTGEPNQVNNESPDLKGKKTSKGKRDNLDWDSLRRHVEDGRKKRERTAETMDSVDWEAVRSADVNEVAQTIKDRGMNNKLAARIKDFLDRLVKEHGSINLEWLRDLPPDKAKEYLLSIRGLGLKSVECVRLLTLHQLAFPVDTNVGRIAVRLGWVPLQPLPETLQLHLLELYPVLESIQKYLWPRLCKLDQKTLYELHYQMITFGKVFCTKSKPNCNACPMRGECRHFASAFASARLPLPGPEGRSLVGSEVSRARSTHPDPTMIRDQLPLLLPQETERLPRRQHFGEKKQLEAETGGSACEPIIEEPASPEPERVEVPVHDIEDLYFEDPDDIPTIKLNMETFTKNLQSYMQENMELQEAEMSKALVALTAEAASIPMPKLKNISQLRTEHQVYELPDSHPLLEGLEKLAPDDPCSYLLAIWTPGETPTSIQPPDRKCISHDDDKLCDDETCFSCNSVREARSQIVRGTLLIPCRTAMRGSFPLNGTYFQVNEVFADHESSLHPIAVPRNWIWSLPRKTVYFGTSIPTIFRGLSTESIQQCFWRGYVCVRGFDRKTRAPRPLMARLHFPASRLSKTKGKTDLGNT